MPSPTLDQAFDPAANARYAIRFLSALYQQTKDWNLATAWYHSQDPERGEEYQRLVFGRVHDADGRDRHVPVTRARMGSGRRRGRNSARCRR